MTACQNGQRHYEVVSPTMTDYGWYEPPEPFVCWGVYLARSAKAAKVMAVADPAFREWVQEQRGEQQPPFKGLTAKPYVCEHGVCLGCDGWACDECEALSDEPEAVA